MLIITRRQNESVVLELPNGQQIELLYMETRRGGEIRLGITAPSDVNIYRKELLHLQAPAPKLYQPSSRNRDRDPNCTCGYGDNDQHHPSCAVFYDLGGRD